jgi:hypothetical protein
MGDYRISKSWLTRRIELDDSAWSWAVEQFANDMQSGDELWHFDEPAPPGVNSGAIGIAHVRSGEPIRTAITVIH